MHVYKYKGTEDIKKPSRHKITYNKSKGIIKFTDCVLVGGFYKLHNFVDVHYNIDANRYIVKKAMSLQDAVDNRLVNIEDLTLKEQEYICKMITYILRNIKIN